MKGSLKLVGLSVVVALLASCQRPRAEYLVAGKRRKPFGLETIIGFYGDFSGRVPSQNYVAAGLTWFKLLQGTVDEGSDVLVNHPGEGFSIDELGFDYDGPTDLKTIKVLKAAKEKKPNLQVAAWQMGGPVAPKLAATYRELVELVMMETYVDLDNSWMIAFKLQGARLNGLVDKSVIGLGIGKQADTKGGWAWTQTREELEQQLRLIRFVAPESPGMVFFGQWSVDEFPITAEDINELCSGFLCISTEGSGLKPELLEVGKTFRKRYEKPALFCTSAFASPEYYPGDPGTDWRGLTAIEPMVLRAPIMNLGEQDAKDVIVRLRHRGDDGEVWAKGIVDVPARSIAIAVLPLLPGHECPRRAGKSTMEVEAPGCEVFTFLDARYWK